MKKSKRICSLLLSAITLICVMAGFSLSAFAEPENIDYPTEGNFEIYDESYKSYFGRYDNFYYVAYDSPGGTATITGYEGDSEYLVIPSEVNNRKVIMTREYSLDNCLFLKAVYIPKDIHVTMSTFDYNAREYLTIYGYEDSKAQEYSEIYDIKFVAVDDPVITDGTDTIYIQGTEEVASIHCVYPMNTFISVTVDDNIVGKENYELTDGSTILTFKPSYLDTLSAGTHTVTIEFTFGTVSSELAIEGTDVNNSVTDKSSEQTTLNVEETTKILKGKDTISPDTGYHSGLKAAFSAGLAASIVLIALKRKSIKP